MIALANYFDSKRTRIQGQASAPEEALLGAMELEERYFGQGLVRRFLRVLGVFPPGTSVELSTQEPAIVTRANPNDPWRPQVKILRGANAGKLVELREMNTGEGRHRFSIVRAIAPPLLVLADAAVVAPVAVQPAAEENVFYEAKAAAPVETTAQGARDRARAELGGMGAILDALLTVPTEALVSAMPPAPSMAPRAIPMSIPPFAPPFAPPPRAPSAMPGPMPGPMPARSPSAGPGPMPARSPSAVPGARPSMPVPLPPPMRPAPIITHAPPPPMTRPPGPSKNPPLVMTRPPPAARPSAPARPMPSGAPPATPAGHSAPPNDPREAERALLERLGPLTAVPVLVADVTKLNLDHRAAFVLRFLDGMSSIEDILDASGLPRLEALSILDNLLRHQVIALR